MDVLQVVDFFNHGNIFTLVIATEVVDGLIQVI
jgi:hypothetical protein